jgi:hypothetical protein
MSDDITEDEPRKAYEAWKKEQAKQLGDSMPLSKRDLSDLFDFLKREGAPSCGHTLETTTLFLRRRKLPTEKILPWLCQQGGHCDCEVIYNVEDKFGETVRTR